MKDSKIKETIEDYVYSLVDGHCSIYLRYRTGKTSSEVRISQRQYPLCVSELVTYAITKIQARRIQKWLLENELLMITKTIQSEIGDENIYDVEPKTARDLVLTETVIDGTVR